MLTDVRDSIIEPVHRTISVRQKLDRLEQECNNLCIFGEGPRPSKVSVDLIFCILSFCNDLCIVTLLILQRRVFC